MVLYLYLLRDVGIVFLSVAGLVAVLGLISLIKALIKTKKIKG